MINTIIVRVEVNYGRETIYPICLTAKRFASIAGTKTLTPKAISEIQGLGYKVEVFNGLSKGIKEAIEDVG